VSNRATLGTNIALHNGLLLVDVIPIRSGASVGHLSMLAPGVALGPGADIGVGGGIGIKTTIGAGAFVSPCSVIEHGVRIGSNASVGAHSYVGSRSTIYGDMKLPAGSSVPPRTLLKNIQSVNRMSRTGPANNYVNAEASALENRVPLGVGVLSAGDEMTGENGNARRVPLH